MAEKESAFHHFDGMCWPVPGPRLDELEDLLRHRTGDLTVSQRHVIASVMAAYRELVTCDERKRRRVRAALTTEMAERDWKRREH